MARTRLRELHDLVGRGKSIRHVLQRGAEAERPLLHRLRDQSLHLLELECLQRDHRREMGRLWLTLAILLRLIRVKCLGESRLLFVCLNDALHNRVPDYILLFETND